MKIAIYAITLHGARQARRLAQTFLFADVFVAPVGKEEYPDANSLTLPLSGFFTEKFADYDHHICFFAAGIVSRMIGPLLRDKRTDPGVVCIDDHGQFVIPMLSGHRGGANAIALQISQALSATPVITTASDVADSLSVDMLGAPFGWTLDPECEPAITATSAAVVNEKRVLIVQHAGEQNWWQHKRSMPRHIMTHPDLSHADLTKVEPAEWDGLVLISDEETPKGYTLWQSKTVLWRPKSLVLGIGCDRNTPLQVLQAGIHQFLEEHNLSKYSISSLASIALKAEEQGILALSEQEQIPFHTYSASELDGVEGIENPSDYVKKITSVSSVAEASALKHSARTQLLVPKWKFKQDGFNMTLACCRITYDEPLAKKKWKNWLDKDVKINLHGNEVVDGFQCKPKHVDLNRPMLYHRHHILLCEGGRCAKEGSKNLAHDLRQVLKSIGFASGEQRIKISRTHCAGTCRNRAAMVIYERLQPNETPINNGLWVKGIDQFTEQTWKELFTHLVERKPLKQWLDPQYIAPIESADELNKL
ncbi:cobalamin biosynthesis protein [Vibrio nigripulchritudo ATCC 27043]|uniref:cobalamin biosynthesis protein n=1 Tax=Vibrio nigripulchritudo TaxID=28173 RepID=UPI00021C2AD0|nr:cobalamin biosynthesis protein [Vibrio nigripulchritudo]EGU50203.1 cobalamin biosynthesis protein [Vibrio nigripulchritudo ATCC 27043]